MVDVLIMAEDNTHQVMAVTIQAVQIPITRVGIMQIQTQVIVTEFIQQQDEEGIKTIATVGFRNSVL